jgi:hypothetical protein
MPNHYLMYQGIPFDGDTPQPMFWDVTPIKVVAQADYDAVVAELRASIRIGECTADKLVEARRMHDDALAAELASTKEMDKLHDRQAHEYYEELKDAESSIALLSARNAQLEAVLLRHGHKDGSCGLCASLEEPPRVAHSKSEYKRLAELGVECAPPATPNYNVPPWHLSKRVPGCRCDGCQSLLVGKTVVAGSVKETDTKHGQPLSTEERAIVDQYLIDVTCPRCYSVKHLCVCPKETKVITEHAVDPTPFSNGAALRESGFRAAAKTKCAECVYDVRNPDWCEVCGTQSSAKEAGTEPLSSCMCRDAFGRHLPSCPVGRAIFADGMKETNCEGALSCPVCGKKSCNCGPGYIP